MLVFLFLIFIEIYLIFCFRSLLLKIVLIVSLLPQITLLAFSFGFPTPGVLMLQASLFSSQTILMANILSAVFTFILLFILFPLRKKTYYYKSFNCTTFSYIIILSIIFITALLSYPRVSGLDIRIDMATIYIAANTSLLLCRKERSSFLNILHLSILLLVIIGGDRVDSMASVILVMLFVKKNNIVGEQLSNRVILCGGGILFILGIVSGLIRDGNSISIDSFIYSIYAQQTVSDVVFVFLSSIEYFNNHGNVLEIAGNLLFGLFPGPFYGVVSPYNYTIFLNNNFFPNPGGGLFYSEGMLILGSFGVVMYALLYAWTIRILFNKKSYIYSSIFITLIIMVFRIQWYGIEYCYKPIVFSVFFTLFFLSIRNGIIGKNLH